jgi:hypothetical protein
LVLVVQAEVQLVILVVVVVVGMEELPTSR